MVDSRRSASLTAPQLGGSWFLTISWICSRSRAIYSQACRTWATASGDSGAMAADLRRPSISVRESMTSSVTPNTRSMQDTRKSAGGRWARWSNLAVPDNYFDDWIAENCERLWPELFSPAVVDPAV